MDPGAIRAKFGQNYAASERTFVMGIDRRLTAKIAERFRNRLVLETCTGGGFTTIALARVAAHVITVEIDPAHQTQARRNLATAGLLDRVTFVLADVMDDRTWDGLPRVDAALLDPDWAYDRPRPCPSLRALHYQTARRCITRKNLRCDPEPGLRPIESRVTWVGASQPRRNYSESRWCTMSVFCLVHGSTQGPKGWELLVPELRRAATTASALTCRPIIPTQAPPRTPAQLAGAWRNQNVRSSWLTLQADCSCPYSGIRGGFQAGVCGRRNTDTRRELPVPVPAGSGNVPGRFCRQRSHEG